MRLLLIATLLASSSVTATPTLPLPPALPLAALEDYRVPAGTRLGDTLRASFAIQEVRWRPEGVKGAQLTAYAFVETGKPARVPGPLLRAPSGTVVRVTLRNTLPVSLMVYGLQDHAAGKGTDSLAIAPGATRVVTFTATAVGTYYYWARVRPAVQHPAAPVPDEWPSGEKQEGPLVGALIVDPRGVAPPRGERILLITRWLDDDDPRVHHDPAFKMMVNGASWPSTERLRYTVGDTVRWRVINATASQHPMHLHGFYYDITGRGDGQLDTLYAPGQERRVVTEMLPLNGTMSLTWVPERAGNWLFHCHLVRHMAPVQQIEPRTPSAGAHAGASAGVHHAEDNMAGLVMGIHVSPRAGRLAARDLARANGRDVGAAARRQLRLVATQRAGVFGTSAAQSFVLQEGGAAPARDSVRFPASTLVLRRGEPVAITVVNGLTSPLAVHWHGMELESWFDGVGGWSGAGTRVRPPIAPGDSFVVRMTPPRAGTFIYHTHDEAGSELSTGLYGALIVEEPGAPRDTTRDHVIVLGQLGKPGEHRPAANGRTTPDPLPLAPGTHRLRLVSIPVDEQFQIAFVRDTTVLNWTLRAVDGAELPASQQRTVRARRTVSAGQTFDVDVTIPADAEGYALRVTTRWYPTDPRGAEPAPVLVVPIRVRR
ncbi:MAG: multicopper oxidase domain-containing protein [Gemmatimonadetes bacterium]|nr:multicopper oxidase domain-containing protein [Gemmatimonadota bacterium]